MSHHFQRQRFLRSDSNSCKNQRLDRFIPNRSAIDFGYAHYMVTEGKDKDMLFWDELYLEAANIPNRILSFRNKPSSSSNPNPNPNSPQSKPPVKPFKRPKIPQNCDRTLVIPGILDDFSFNLLDWGTSNLLALGHEHTVYLYNPSARSHSQLLTVDQEDGPVTSVSWAPDGTRLAIGFNNSLVHLWDTSTMTHLKTLRAGHRAGVGSLAWNNSHILTTGGMDGKIVNNDVRLRSHVVHTYTGHQQEVCGLKWSLDGQQLASGGNDNVVHIWDKRSVLSSNSPTTRCWLHKFQEHTAPVKALAWCPFRSNLLASGGGQGDQCIKLWDTSTGARLKSVDTGSEVCALLWNKYERELLSSHGFTHNHFTFWKYPSMSNMAEIHKGHTSRVLYLTPSPDGCTVASASADGTLRLWNFFGTPAAAPAPPPKKNYEPFTSFNHIR